MLHDHAYEEEINVVTKAGWRESQPATRPAKDLRINWSWTNGKEIPVPQIFVTCLNRLENLADFISQDLSPSYGHENKSAETRDALLYGHLHKELIWKLLL